MKKPYERTILSPMGEGTIYKRRIEYVAWCVKCDSAIRGNGSVIVPYNCECRTYKYSVKADGYVEYTDGIALVHTKTDKQTQS